MTMQQDSCINQEFMKGFAHRGKTERRRLPSADRVNSKCEIGYSCYLGFTNVPIRSPAIARWMFPSRK